MFRPDLKDYTDEEELVPMQKVKYKTRQIVKWMDRYN